MEAKVWPDGLCRCGWANPKNPAYVAYHDTEWGTPSHNDRHQFEMLILEGAQAGLSWETILNRRASYKEAFANFDPAQVAAFTDAKLEALLQNPGIIRNRLKVFAARKNAQVFCQIQQEFGTFSAYIWDFVNHTPILNTFTTLAEVPARTPVSDALSKDLKKRGMSFVGSTIIYAHMQATGLTQDHLTTCFRHPQNTLAKSRPTR